MFVLGRMSPTFRTMMRKVIVIRRKMAHSMNQAMKWLLALTPIIFMYYREKGEKKNHK